MRASDIIGQVIAPRAEHVFFAKLVSRSDPKLREWARNYYHFSIHQARHLALMIRAFPPAEWASISEVAKALFEEYGSGVPEAVHSQLFARFALAAGVMPQSLSDLRHQITPAVLAYVDEIEAAYTSGDLPTALGAYAYLERSAVLSYPLMLNAFSRLGFAAEALQFFHTHVIQEKDHDAAAGEIAERHILTEQEHLRFGAQVRRMDTLWTGVWESFA